jgi:diadenosine tetraphosphatase ApaH/serine/threonine PP2A family protein phosphatase
MQIERPFACEVGLSQTIPEQLSMDLMWSDPSKEETGIRPSNRDGFMGSIKKFGPDRVVNFLRDTEFTRIFRAHECVMSGIEDFADTGLTTIFSASNYGGCTRNAAGMIMIDKDGNHTRNYIYPHNRMGGW